jgi:hypothetical protein
MLRLHVLLPRPRAEGVGEVSEKLLDALRIASRQAVIAESMLTGARLAAAALSEDGRSKVLDQLAAAAAAAQLGFRDAAAVVSDQLLVDIGDVRLAVHDQADELDSVLNGVKS